MRYCDAAYTNFSASSILLFRILAANSVSKCERTKITSVNVYIVLQSVLIVSAKYCRHWPTFDATTALQIWRVFETQCINTVY